MSKKRQYRDFQVVDADGFIWRGHRLGFDSIRHVFFSWVKVTADADKAYLRITLLDGQEIRLDFDKDVLVSSSIPGRNEDIDNLKKLYVYLCARSFEHRIAHYLQELKEEGYFTVEECTFYPEEKVVRHRGKVYSVSSYDFLKGIGYVQIKKKNMTRWESFKSEFSLHPPAFNTQTDPDVVFALLDKFFGLRWED